MDALVFFQADASKNQQLLYGQRVVGELFTLTLLMDLSGLLEYDLIVVFGNQWAAKSVRDPRLIFSSQS